MTTITPERLAKLREKVAALQANEVEYEYRSPWYVNHSDEVSILSCRNCDVAEAYEPVVAAYIAAADPQTVLALVEEVERLRDIETDLLVCEADCRDLQSFVAELRESNAKVTDARDNLLDEVGRLRAKNAAYHERLHYPCDGCPGCSSSDCPDALHIAQIDLAVWQHEAKRLQARVAELEAAMAQRMGVYAAPKDERQVGS